MRRAFTLIELLTAMAVLAVILVMMLQVTNGVLQSTRAQNQQLDSVATARRALDIMVSDLELASLGDQTSILTSTPAGTNLFAALTSRRGPGDSPANHRFLAVRYNMDTNNRVFRAYGSVNFNSPDLLSRTVSGTTTTPSEPLASGILALQIFALTEDGDRQSAFGTASPSWATNNYGGQAVPGGWQALVTGRAAWAASLTNRTRALEIWIAALDPRSYELLEKSGKLNTARAALSGTPSGWREQFDAAEIPPPTKSALRVLNRTIPLR